MKEGDVVKGCLSIAAWATKGLRVRLCNFSCSLCSATCGSLDDAALQIEPHASRIFLLLSFFLLLLLVLLS